MDPVAFLSHLQVHFPVKHDTPQAGEAWLKSMMATLRGTAPDVLQAAAEHIMLTRKYRAFPLPAELREACAIVADRIAAERERKGETPSDPVFPPRRASVDPDFARRSEDATAWRQRMAAECGGSFDAWLTKNRHRIVDERFGQRANDKPIASKTSTFKRAMPDVPSPRAYKEDNA